MSFTINLQIPPELENISDELNKRRRRFFDELAKEIAQEARKNVGSQGQLSRSIVGHATGVEDAIVEATAPYAKAQEKGAYIVAKGRSTRTGRPARLRFVVDGRVVYPKAVRIPAKNYMKKALSKRRSIGDRVFKDVFGDLGSG